MGRNGTRRVEAKAVRTGVVESMRHAAEVACETLGVDPLNVVTRGESVIIESEGVVLEIRDEGGHSFWELAESYQVAEAEEGFRTRHDVKGRFDIGDETRCARAAAMLVASHRIDDALDKL